MAKTSIIPKSIYRFIANLHRQKMFVSKTDKLIFTLTRKC